MTNRKPEELVLQEMAEQNRAALDALPTAAEHEALLEHLAERTRAALDELEKGKA